MLTHDGWKFLSHTQHVINSEMFAAEALQLAQAGMMSR